jgi:hypothetical protein
VIFAIDPGNEQSGFAILENGRVKESGVRSNEDMLREIDLTFIAYPEVEFAIEMIASYGMPVGADVFETCLWIGRFVERIATCGKVARLVFRRDVKMHLCASPRAKDPHIRQALIDKLGPPGTKKAPGGTHGVKSHAWAALAVAVTASELPEAA